MSSSDSPETNAPRGPRIGPAAIARALTTGAVAIALASWSLPSASNEPATSAPWTVKRTRSELEALTGVRPVSVDGRPHHLRERTSDAGRQAARTYLAGRFRDLGYEVSIHDFGRGHNLIARREGHSGRDLVVSAHYDAANGVPGADDDASGVIATLAIADALRNLPLEHGLRVVLFDQEERGLWGSAAYLAQRVGLSEEIVGNIQIEMIGHDSNGDGRFAIGDCERVDNLPLRDAVIDALMESPSLLEHEFWCTNASDHASFWDHDIPAIVVSQSYFGAHGDPNPCYHRPCDTVDRLNFEYMTAMIGLLVDASASIVADRSNPRSP